MRFGSLSAARADRAAPIGSAAAPVWMNLRRVTIA
jgi:hypothetical protein